MKSYDNVHDANSWGSFYLCKTKDDQSRSKPLYSGPCMLCDWAERFQDQKMGRICFREHWYGVMEDPQPTVKNQQLLFRVSAPKTSKPGAHRIDIHTTDIELIIQLSTHGFAEWMGSSTHEFPHGHRRMPNDPVSNRRPWAIYTNIYPGNDGMESHFHMHGVPADSIPLLKSSFAPWQICRHKKNGTLVSRLLDTRFYIMALRGRGIPEVSETLMLMHRLMMDWGIPYHLVVYPLKREPIENLDDICVAIVPRDHIYSEAVDQKLTGLEFLTGILTRGPQFVGPMDTVQRDFAFSQATLQNNHSLELERGLRALMGLPPAGYAVYPKYTTHAQYQPAVRSNTVLKKHNILSRHWIKPSKTIDLSYEKQWNEPNVLVRIVRASICQSDRRVLLGTKRSNIKKENYVLGHEAGGYIVDPGPWENELRAGDQVVILPHLTCGNCRPCHRYKQNLCQNMIHLGFDLNGSMAELMSFPYQCILPVEPHFPNDALPLVEPLACILRALFRIRDPLARLSSEAVKLSGRINPFTVFGAGPIGCLTARAVKRFWPDVRIKMVEPLEKRRTLVQQLAIAEEVVEQLSGAEKNWIGFVASSKLKASMDALASAQKHGTLMMFSGINTDDLEFHGEEIRTDAKRFESIHRQESDVYQKNKSGVPCRLIGSSGYTFDDSERSIRELQQYYEHYKIVQNVVVEGLAAREAYYREPILQKRRFGSSAVTLLLSPRGVDDEKHGGILAETLKVLIHV